MDTKSWERSNRSKVAHTFGWEKGYDGQVGGKALICVRHERCGR